VAVQVHLNVGVVVDLEADEAVLEEDHHQAVAMIEEDIVVDEEQEVDEEEVLIDHEIKRREIKVCDLPRVWSRCKGRGEEDHHQTAAAMIVVGEIIT
jgi:hypothetical protein